MDLPGFGYARGGSAGFDALTAAVFDRQVAAILLVDARHPGLENDRAAWTWLSGAARDAAIVVTKIDKLSRTERLRAIGENEAVFDHPVTAVSAVTGEGLDELWTLIDQLANNPQPRNKRSSPANLPVATAQPRARNIRKK